MDLTRLLPWNWLRRPAPEERTPVAPRLAVRREDEHDGWPDPDSPEAVSYELERLFDHVFSGFGFNAPHLQAAAQAARPCIPPNSRTCERGGCQVIELDLPGVLEQDITLVLRGRRLTMLALRRADAPADADGPDRVAYRFVLNLNENADLESIEPLFRSFRLELTIPLKAATVFDRE